MCSFSWWADGTGYGWLFNRDELNSRAAEMAPTERAGPAGRWLAPRDGEAGGTWLAVNAQGVSLVLLNDYLSPAPAPPLPRSRGHLIPTLAASPGLPEIQQAMAHLDLTAFRPFQLVALAPDVSPWLWHWDGKQLQDRQAPPFLTSSSDQPAIVTATRQRRFAALAQPLTRSERARFHYHHDPANSAVSPLMHRPDAATRSITTVQVARDLVHLSYQPISWRSNAPHLDPAGTWELARA